MQHNQIHIHILLPPCQILAQRNPITDKMKTDGEKFLPTPLTTLKLTIFSQKQIKATLLKILIKQFVLKHVFLWNTLNIYSLITEDVTMAVSLTFSLDFKELGCSFCQSHGGVSLGRHTGPVVQVALWACRAAVDAIWTTDGLKEEVNLCNQWLCESENSTSSNTAFPPPSSSPGPLLQLPSFMSLCAFSNWKAIEQSSGEGLVHWRISLPWFCSVFS